MRRPAALRVPTRTARSRSLRPAHTPADAAAVFTRTRTECGPQRRETAEGVRGTVVGGSPVCPGTDTARLPEGRSRHLGGCEKKGDV